MYKRGPATLACTAGPAVSRAMLRSTGNRRGAPLKGSPARQHAVVIQSLIHTASYLKYLQKYLVCSLQVLTIGALTWSKECDSGSQC